MHLLDGRGNVRKASNWLVARTLITLLNKYSFPKPQRETPVLPITIPKPPDIIKLDEQAPGESSDDFRLPQAHPRDHPAKKQNKETKSFSLCRLESFTQR